MRTAFTIATANYLAQAKTVADSFLLHNTGYHYTIFLLDKIDKIDTAFFAGIQILEVEALQLSWFSEMVERYSIFELSNALKPFCAAYLFRTGNELIVYLDSDIIVYGTFLEMEKALRESEIVLTPHMLVSPPDDGKALTESDFLNAGIYNGGFFALRQGGNADRFLIWWKERMRDKCFVDFAKGLFVDQIWLNFVPLYFQGVCILKNTGYNASYWNLHERSITQSPDGKYLVNEATPLTFFHFSGYDFAEPHLMSRYQTRFLLSDLPVVGRLYAEYADKVFHNKYEEFSRLSCYYVECKKKPEPQEVHVPVPIPGLKTRIRNRLKRILVRWTH